MRHDDGAWEAIERDVLRLGIDAACQRHGIHRSTWYRHEGRKSSTTSQPGDASVLRARIRVLALENPAWGCDRIAYYLSFEGVKRSSPTVQKILIELGLGRRSEREMAKREQGREQQDR